MYTVFSATLSYRVSDFRSFRGSENSTRVLTAWVTAWALTRRTGDSQELWYASDLPLCLTLESEAWSSQPLRSLLANRRRSNVVRCATFGTFEHVRHATQRRGGGGTTNGFSDLRNAYFVYGVGVRWVNASQGVQQQACTTPRLNRCMPSYFIKRARQIKCVNCSHLAVQHLEQGQTHSQQHVSPIWIQIPRRLRLARNHVRDRDLRVYKQIMQSLPIGPRP